MDNSQYQKSFLIAVSHTDKKQITVVGEVQKIMKKMNIIENNIGKLLLHNKYEKLVPFNLWFLQ